MKRIANLEPWSTGKVLLLVLILGCAKAPAEQPEPSPSIEEGSLYSCIAKDLNQGKPLVITVYVALCDWKHQGVIGVDGSPIANGDDPDRNLYWGGWEGLRGYFKTKDAS